MSGPSSQILTSKSVARINPTQKQSQKQVLMAYFLEVLTSSGVVLRYDTSPNIISQEQSLVIRDIERTLKSHISYPNNAEEFLNGLKRLCEKDADFRKALISTQLRKTSTNDYSTSLQNPIEQQSLIKLLVNVKCLQNGIIEMLFERVTSEATKEDNDTIWIRLVLNPLRYMVSIKDAKVLATNLLDILEVATNPAQLELLNILPEIIPDSEYEETAKQLIKLLDEKNELKGAIIDCLNSLNLSADIRATVQEHILIRLLTNSYLKIFPILFQFLTTDCTPATLLHVLRSSREALDMILSSDSPDIEDQTNKVLASTCAITASKKLCESWINVVSSLPSHSEHKSIDVLILIMIHSSGHCRKSTVEATFKKQIKSGHFKTSLVDNMFEQYFVPQLMKDHLNSMIEIAGGLLKFQNEPLLLEFSSAMYTHLFEHEDVDRMQRQDIIHNLIFLTRASDQRMVSMVLSILDTLGENAAKLQKHSAQLMGLLEKLDTFDLEAVKKVFNLLCGLTCGEAALDSLSGLKDEIHMIIRKQLSSSKRIVKHRGIIAAITMVKFIVLKSNKEGDDSHANDTSITSIADLPQGPVQDAARLLELAYTSSSNCPESIGLYYDELASMIKTMDTIDKYFMEWLFTSITKEFQDVFVTPTVSQPINDIHLSMQYSLNEADEEESPIAVNIGELTLKPQYNINSSILLLAPLFNLLRLLHYCQHNGDLESIDALLGCAIIMPDITAIDNYDSDQLKQITDCIFHCINWFREVVSAFVVQKTKRLRKRVLERLKNLVKLEQQLELYIKKVPDHKLPLCQFDVDSQKSNSPGKAEKMRRPKKRAKTEAATNVDETIASTSAAVTQTTKTSANKKKAVGDTKLDIKINFRQMDTDVVRLLKYPLDINENIIQQQESQCSQQNFTLDIKQMLFILNDFSEKLRNLPKQTIMEHSHITLTQPTNFICDCMRVLLPFIRKQLNTIIHCTKKLLEQSDEIHDSLDMFTPEAKDLKLAFWLIFECFSIIFAWPGFQNPNHLNLLRDCLKALRDEQASQLSSANQLTLEFMNKMLSYTNQCLYLPAAVSLVKTMQALQLVNMNPEMQKKIVTVSGKLLSRKWYNLNGTRETGKISYANIEILIKSYLSGASVKTISGLVGTLQTQLPELQSKEDSLPMLGSIDKANLHIFYRCLCNALLEGVRKEITSLTNNEHLVLWRTTVLTMQGLMTIIKVHESRANFSSFLKNSLGILKIFLSHGMPILEIMLRSKPDEVLEILKTLQTSTRFLHHLCCQSKFTKDASLVAYVPQFRLTLETLLYRVKAALVANNCSAAFWMGTLRNRDLHGDDILSQSTIASNEDAPQVSDNEELPSDDSDEEMAMEETTSNGSASDVY